MIRVGVSGWSYAEWRGDFYPKDLRMGEALAFASSRFATIELNATFYGPQPAARYRRWRESVPPGFVFAVKGPRQATHAGHAVDIEAILARFFAAGVLDLAETLGPFLWQFPAGLAFEAAPLARFLAALPRDRRHAVEARHESFASPESLDLLRREGVALVAAHAPRWPLMAATTASFSYVRLHGAPQLYESGYDDAALDAWAARIREWSAGGRDVYVYFNNTKAGRGPHDAVALARRLNA